MTAFALLTTGGGGGAEGADVGGGAITNGGKHTNDDVLSMHKELQMQLKLEPLHADETPLPGKQSLATLHVVESQFPCGDFSQFQYWVFIGVLQFVLQTAE